ncbi:hypothetical protein WJX84_000681 [Apatococcus fuscideae]|uniref:RNase III domain-containing protein n=1 Tax=Apatococcus fuscideae TaxID=2026836 RepID=A0AAW1T8I6_9CHLO
MLSSRAASLARRRSLRLLCRWQASNVQLSQQDVALLAAGSPEGPLTVTLQVPAQQLIATIVTSPAAEGPKYSLEAESREAEGVSTAEPGASTSGEQSSRPPSPEQHPPKSLQPLLDHVCNRSLRPRVWQGEAMMPTPEQLDAAERELQYNFKDKRLLQQAFLAPGALENSYSNRPLAWFGDAALTLLVMEGISARLARQDESCLETGEPTLLRDRLVSRDTCARNIRKLNCHRLLTPSYGAHVTENMVAELFEAVLGAVYLDGGLAEARRIYEFHWPLPEKLGAPI